MTTAPRRVYLYVGAAKSGTTYLQQIMWDNRIALREQGFLFPGEVWASQVFAALDLRRLKMGGDENPLVQGTWRAVTDEVRDWGGPTACIAQEMLAGAAPRQIDRAVRKLGAFAEVHLVWTLRDMARVLPASWQEWIRNREVDSFAEYLAAVRAAAPVAGAVPDGAARCARQFWSMQNTVGVLARWSASIPPERVHVLTVPGADAPPRALWDRFASVVGLEDASIGTLDRPANASLSAVSAGLLRDFNIAVGGHAYPWRAYDAVVKHDIAAKVAAVPGPPIDLPPDTFDWARSWAGQVVEQLGAAGYDIVGDLDDVIPSMRPTGVDPDAVDRAEQAEIALVAMSNFARRAADAEKHIAGLGQQLDAARTALAQAQATVAEHRDLRPLERVKRCGVELAQQVRWAQKAYRLTAASGTDTTRPGWRRPPNQPTWPVVSFSDAGPAPPPRPTTRRAGSARPLR